MNHLNEFHLPNIRSVNFQIMCHMSFYMWFDFWILNKILSFILDEKLLKITYCKFLRVSESLNWFSIFKRMKLHLPKTMSHGILWYWVMLLLFHWRPIQIFNVVPRILVVSQKDFSFFWREFQNVCFELFCFCWFQP